MAHRRSILETDNRTGLIVKILGGFYYVTSDDEILECRARGLFRKNQITPLVGDYCKVRITKEDSLVGYIEEILPRKNELLRPPVANVDQIIIVFSSKNPNPNVRLIDKFLIQNEYYGVSSIICINKMDLDWEEGERLKLIYEKAGYDVILTSSGEIESLALLKDKLVDKISAFAGPSGVGKSTLLNQIEKSLDLKTGEISEKLNRGKHTTRHVELFKLSIGGWVVDTAGFSSLDLEKVTKSNLKDYFIEFSQYDNCRFSDCHHYREPGCHVKEMVGTKAISPERYTSYLELYEILLSGGKI
jgi:ribosome biogenesis GTPase